jgi:hypothetical protein
MLYARMHISRSGRDRDSVSDMVGRVSYWQLLNVEHDMKNYQTRSLCYQPKSKAEYVERTYR